MGYLKIFTRCYATLFNTSLSFLSNKKTASFSILFDFDFVLLISDNWKHFHNVFRINVEYPV